MEFWLWLLDTFGVVIAIALVLVVGLSVRRRVLARGGSTFDLSLNTRQGKSVVGARGWVLGVGRYGDTELEWFRTFSFAWRPQRRFQRGHVQVVKRRDPVGPEAYSLHAGAVIVECLTDAGPVQLGLAPDALTGFLAWLESAPPGREIHNVL